MNFRLIISNIKGYNLSLYGIIKPISFINSIWNVLDNKNKQFPQKNGKLLEWCGHWAGGMKNSIPARVFERFLRRGIITPFTHV